MGILEIVFNSRKFDLNDDVLMGFDNYFDKKSKDYNSFCSQIASSSWTPSGRKLGLPQPLRLRKQCQGMLQRVLLECSTPDSSSEGC